MFEYKDGSVEALGLCGDRSDADVIEEPTVMYLRKLPGPAAVFFSSKKQPREALGRLGWRAYPMDGEIKWWFNQVGLQYIESPESTMTDFDQFMEDVIFEF